MSSRLERRVRSSILGFPFVVTNAMTRYEIFGRDHLLAAVERHRRTGHGLITVSNHQSLFDDPMVLMALLGLRDFSVETKYWWSTPCQSNFSPAGKSLRDRFVRYFSDVSNMVFLARRSKSGRCSMPHSYLDQIGGSGRPELVDRITRRAVSLGIDGESYLRRFVTPGREQSLGPLNQLGMVEACARVDLGDWLHFFPEGGRSRSVALGAPKRGVGKVLYHCGQAEVVPICFCGMHTVLPISAALLRPFQRVVVFVGEPVSARKLALLRIGAPSPEQFQELASLVWEPIQSLWPLALARYQRQRPVVTPFQLPPELATAPIPAEQRAATAAAVAPSPLRRDRDAAPPVPLAR